MLYLLARVHLQTLALAKVLHFTGACSVHYCYDVLIQNDLISLRYNITTARSATRLLAKIGLHQHIDLITKLYIDLSVLGAKSGHKQNGQ